ncbi:MAG: SBBP repeat-containing protein [Candidatus Aminicenantes bacterium]|nr:MAG: SBBP repeat-containing protein [Candidatus Aminicenantes bacterium]
MKRFLILSLVVCAAFVFIAAARPGERPLNPVVVKQDPDFGTIPLYFVPNQGQVDEKVRFYARTPRYTLWITKKGLVFDGIKESERDVSRLVFVGSNPDPPMVPLEKTSYQVNYLKGNKKTNWYTGIRTSKAVKYKDIYRNIDLKVYGMEKQIEYDWVVRPGGNPGDICFRYKNVKGTRIDDNGDLHIQTRLGELIHKRPVSYQDVGMEHGAWGKDQRVEAAVEFKKISENTYGFEVDAYDRSRELIIDPVVMAYSTYLGGSGDEHGFGLAVDNSGSAYVTGDTYSTDFPTEDAYQNTFGGGDMDAFVTKFSASGKSLIYSTYLGGSGRDAGEGIQVDSSGQAYVVGFTYSTDFPTQNAYQNTHQGGNQDVFVTILSSSGSGLVYSTFLGGTGVDIGFAIDLDSSKNIYVTGRTASSDFPTQNAFQDTFAGGEYDVFVTKFNSSGSLGFSTYLGAGKKETGFGIAVKGNNAYVVGNTTSGGFPTQNEYQGSHGGGTYDAFVTKFSSSGNNLIYSTFLGGSQDDQGYGIDVDSSGSAYVTGSTYSTDFPTQKAYQGTYGGSKDAFVTKFSTDGTSLEYSTYLGGVESDAAAHLALSSSGNACVTGYTKSSNFPTARAYQNSFNGDYDVFVSMLALEGSGLSFSTFLGGGDADSGRGIALDNSGNIYVAGYTESPDFPTENAYQSNLKGDIDAFVGKFSTSEIGTLCGSLDNCDLTWTTGGSADWFDQGDTYYYDKDAARSGDIGDNQSSYIQTTVTGPGLLSFWWKVSSETWNDYLIFYLDGAYQHYISGDVDWQQKTYAISEGTHTCKWAYEKDYCCISGSDCGWLDKVEFTPHPEIVLNRTQLTFGAVSGSSTGDQTFTVSNATASTLSWSAAVNQTWLSCSPTSGTNTGVVTVSVDPTGLSVGPHTGAITVSDPNASNNPQAVTVIFNVFQANHTSVPFGEYATPTDGSTVMSSVPFTGWVLDDLGVEGVKIYRQEGGFLVFVGDAMLVEGARPDVEQAYPDYPYNYKAGWGYMMLTNFLPNGGNGTFTIKAIATDVEGHQVTLGSKTVTVDNASAVKPFGAIDTPTQGGTASGDQYVNWGWVLTPQPNSIPIDGSTISVYVDGVNLGNPNYNINRLDIANLFPGYANTDGAAGYFMLDTTAYQDGVHTIQWVATDDGGNTDGIGSRYFMIQNSASEAGAAYASMSKARVSLPLFPLISGMPVEVNDFAPVEVKLGYSNETHQVPVMKEPDESGMIRVQIRELDRLEVHFNFEKNSQVCGWMVVGNQMRTLPPGSTFLPDKGIFCWQAGLGYVGPYQLAFIGTDQYGNMIRKDILVNIISKY